jgi:hypothetical protein
MAMKIQGSRCRYLSSICTYPIPTSDRDDIHEALRISTHGKQYPLKASEKVVTKLSPPSTPFKTVPAKIGLYSDFLKTTNSILYHISHSAGTFKNQQFCIYRKPRISSSAQWWDHFFSSALLFDCRQSGFVGSKVAVLKRKQKLLNSRL